MTFITDVVSSYVHEAEIFAGNMQAMAPTDQCTESNQKRAFITPLVDKIWYLAQRYTVTKNYIQIPLTSNRQNVIRGYDLVVFGFPDSGRCISRCKSQQTAQGV